MRFEIAALAGVSLLLASLDAASQPTAAEEVAALRAQVAMLSERLARLEQSIASQGGRAAPVAEAPRMPAPEPLAPLWTETASFSGELRYRHESINDDAASARHRHRIRARANVSARLSERMTATLGLSTGGRANDSGNQTLEDGFSRKDIGVDLAYLDWGLGETVDVVAGKMPNPFFRPAGHHLIYDSDIRPEGLALRFDSGPWFGNASAFWVEERADGADSMLFGVQGGYLGTLPGGAGFTAGMSYYETTHAQGRAAFFTPGEGQGNQLDAGGSYVYGFSEIELFGELRLDLAGERLSLFVDYVTNTDAGEFDEGFALGAAYRELSSPGDWTLGYVYQDLEANAVVGALTDSDFAGGTSDGSGHIFQAGYLFPGGWNVGLRYVIGDRGEAAGNERDYNRLQADIAVRY